MKKSIAALTALLAIFAVISVGAQAKLKDGFYFAEESAFQSSGWKDQVVLQVAGGKIVAASWNGVNSLGVADKKTVSAAGGYGMIKASKIGKEWHEQAAIVEKNLVATQNTAADAVSGATMGTKGFYALVKAALASKPVAKGSYAKDGWFYAISPAFDSTGYKSTALITVVNGTIVSANWNGISKDGGDSKFVRATKGSYKMGAKQGEWHVQSPRIAAALIKSQDPAKIALKADGKTDAVSGVSIQVNGFIAVAAEALKAAK